MHSRRYLHLEATRLRLDAAAGPQLELVAALLRHVDRARGCVRAGDRGLEDHREDAAQVVRAGERVAEQSDVASQLVAARVQLVDVAAQLVGHLVERRGQPADLVLAPHVDAGVEVTTRNPRRGGGQLHQRPRGDPGEQPSDESRENQRGDQHGDDECLESADLRPINAQDELGLTATDRRHRHQPAAVDLGLRGRRGGDRLGDLVGSARRQRRGDHPAACDEGHLRVRRGLEPLDDALVQRDRDGGLPEVGAGGGADVDRVGDRCDAARRRLTAAARPEIPG